MLGSRFELLNHDLPDAWAVDEQVHCVPDQALQRSGHIRPVAQRREPFKQRIHCRVQSRRVRRRGTVAVSVADGSVRHAPDSNFKRACARRRSSEA